MAKLPPELQYECLGASFESHFTTAIGRSCKRQLASASPASREAGDGGSHETCIAVRASAIVVAREPAAAHQADKRRRRAVPPPSPALSPATTRQIARVDA